MKALVVAVAGWLAAIVVVAALVVDGRNAALERAERSSQALARVMEEHTVRTFHGVHLTLAAVTDAWALASPAKNDPDFQALLQHRLKDLPHVRALFVVGADGFLIHDTNHPHTPRLNLADRDYFRVHRDNPALEQSQSGPVLSRRAAGWFVSVTHRLGTEDKFGGIAVAALEPAYFEALYRGMQESGEEAIALFHRDGTLVARFPAGEQDIGKSFAHLPLFARYLPQAPSGSYRLDGHMMPGRRIVSYRSVQGLPFVVHVSLSEHAVLAGWRRTALAAAFAMAVLTALLGALLAQQQRAGRRRREARARRAQAEKLEAMGQLTGGIVHDFNNLLGLVSMNAELLLRSPGDARIAEQAAAGLQRAVQHGSQLVSRLLAFARRQPLEMRAADLNSLVTEAHPLVAQAAGTHIELVLQLAPGLPPVLVDESQFEMALLNLVVNARDAMSGRGRIVLRSSLGAYGEPCLAVEDNGPGMSERVRQHALEPFFTTKGETGTGLGLAQVYGFMRQIGGNLEIESAPGKGTRVHLRFPRAPKLTGVKARG